MGPKTRAALLLGGAALLINGGYIHAKAILAQVLIARAWAQSKEGAEPRRPWPWADTHPTARLIAPDHGVDLFVLAGASPRNMAFGPGHLESSSPAGEKGNVVLAAHRDTHFAFLQKVKIGDVLTLESRNGTSTRYHVSDTQVVHEDDPRFLAFEDDRLTLITCYPFDAVVPGGPLRYVVVAKPG